ncbi:MAG: hypothetical protein LQ339_003202 [Xanthoria mediterranea]|nr:MAG: hypothetical protein LQ339_003202 [Xanthoria mediterranea]
MFLYLESVLLALLFTPSVLASPLSAPSEQGSLSTRAVINCTSLTAQRNVACWESLKIAEYLTNWQKTTPDCSISGGSGADCCRPPALETWSQCYLRLTDGDGGGYNCNDLNGQNCQISNLVPGDQVDAAVKPHAHYVRATIQNVRDFFVAYNAALNPSLGRLHTILKAFKIDNKKDIVSPAHLQTLLSIPIVLGLNVIAATDNSSLTPHTLEIAHLWSSALASAPAIATALFPPNSTLNTQQLPFTTSPPSPPSISFLLTAALKQTMSSIPSFLALASNGTFSTSASPAVFLPSSPSPTTTTKNTQDLHLGAYTFLTSRFMQSQNLYAIPGQIVTEASWRQYITQGQCTGPAGTICVVPPGGTQNSENIPKFLYWSPRTQRSYELRSKGGTKITVNDLVLGVNEGGFADPEVLFDGNYNCTKAGKAGGAIVRVREGEEVEVGCLSQLPMYLECGMRCPEGAVRVQGLCPFGNVTRC